MRARLRHLTLHRHPVRTSGPVVVGIGEILWDLLPTGIRLGGAPANFAWQARQMGAHGVPVSSVGDDREGARLIAQLRRMGLESEYIEVVPGVPTGTVEVAIDEGGQPVYRIHGPVAWDRISLSERLVSLAQRADAVCVGTLAQRSPETREAIQGFLAATRPECLRVFDVNLRAAGFDRELFERTVARCDVLKINDEELAVLSRELGLPYDEAAAAEELRRSCGVRIVALTLGPRGSLLAAEGICSRCAGRDVRVRDTVGAGDAFAAALAVGILAGQPLKVMHEHAARVSTYVCTQEGAMPELPALFQIAGAGG